MKKSNLLRIAILLLFFGCMATSVHAADSKTSPEDWLNDEEMSYVTSIRAADASARSVIARATVALWDGRIADPTWISNFRAISNQFSAAFGALCIPAPKEFEAIEQDYRALNNSIPSQSQLSSLKSQEITGAIMGVDQLMGLVVVLSKMEDSLNGYEAKLDTIMGKLNAKIADIAKRREKAAELFGELFMSCNR